MSERENELNDSSEREDSNNQSDDNEIYSYSDDSVSSDDLTEDSEMTSVTGTSSSSSSLSAETSFSLSRESPESQSKISNYQRQTHFSSNIGRVQSSTGLGCTRRRNMSFSNMEMMKIERDNQCLLRKIMAQQKQKKNIGFTKEAVPVRLASSAINRKKMQRRIEEDNITILRKIQGAKSSSLSGKSIGLHESTSY